MAITLTRGDTGHLTITVIDVAGAPVNLTDMTVRFTAKRGTRDAQSAAIIAKTTGAGIVHLAQAGATLGQATVTIDPADTSGLPGSAIALVYDVQVTNNDGITTTETGTLLLTPDVTT